MSKKINQVTSLGQSIWYDNIQRRSLKNGDMKALIEQVGIRGVTSNPSIFHSAIANSNDYDEELKDLASKGLSSQEIFWRLAIQDIKNAADLFSRLYEKSNGKDGFVSLEVDPGLAYDAEATVLEAKKLWQEVDRKNLMVKIPATKECIPAIRSSIAAGINVNVTLIFSVERYKQVIMAYLEGLNDRIDQGLPIDHVSSVASFFVSRIDSKIDPTLSVGSKTKGNVAIASAKIAYHEFQKYFSEKEYKKLQEHGAQLQRPLWASTSTKNEEYSDTLYVDELIGPNTVNTIPPKTLDAFIDHGNPKITIDKDLSEAQEINKNLSSEGISLQKVTDELENEGVKAFQNSFNELLDAIEFKRK